MKTVEERFKADRIRAVPDRDAPTTKTGRGKNESAIVMLLRVRTFRALSLPVDKSVRGDYNSYGPSLLPERSR
jgi:hypothetical protein